MTAIAEAGRKGWGRLADKADSLSGWRRHGATFLIGALTATAFAPIHAIPVLLISFTGLIWLVDSSRSARAAFAAGWWFAWGQFIAGLYWIGISMLTDPEKFGWMIPFAVGGLSAYLAFYTGLATLALRLSGARGPGRILVFAAAWTAAEWARGHALTGFPWNLTGNVWTAAPPVLQFAAVTGAYGLSLITVLVAASPAVLADEAPRRWFFVAAAFALLATIWFHGAFRLAGAEPDMTPGVKLRIVQPNIAQHDKWLPDQRSKNFAKLLALSGARGSHDANAIIWPETAAPFLVANDPRRRRIMAGVVPQGGLLITGAMRATPPRQKFQIWNSVHAVDMDGAVRATYDKFHLVPFGEFVPLRSIIGFAKLTPGNTDFSRGIGPRTINLPELPPFSPLVCYEIIFPGAATQPGARPAWLLNVTNDAWFGISSGPHQHLASARVRAVEEGLPLVRAANTGISAVVDSYGRTLVQLGLGREGVIDSQLPAAQLTPTIYSRAGDWIVLALMLLFAAAGLSWRRR